jgi:glycosyltransferase involved in cell wall biosynthesis
VKTSIVMTTYRRPQYLRVVLQSIAAQDLRTLDYEILVVNDGPKDETEAVVKSFRDKLVVRYLHSGVRNDQDWRTMGFAANIGIQHVDGEIVVLTNSDMYHVGEVAVPVVEACARDSKALSTVGRVYEDDGRLINGLIRGEPDSQLGVLFEELRTRPELTDTFPANPDMPFFMALRREHLMRVGGYDEDFIGCASEDCDLIDRLLALGCRYHYGDESCELVHLYHGKRCTRAEFRRDSDFIYNAELRAKRRGQLVRNVGRSWGRLATEGDAKTQIHLVVWVTSKCNLECSRCNQRAARSDCPEYDMSQQELTAFIESCKRRKIQFTTVELTGGEPTRWSLFESGLKQLTDSGIAEDVTFITNGREAKKVARIARKCGIRYTVSAQQAAEEQQELHRRYGVGVMWIDNPHRPVPASPVRNSLPASCSQTHDRAGRSVTQLLYYRGHVLYCCMALANSQILQKAPPSCEFEADFIRYFEARQFDQPICSVCLCNSKVWAAQTKLM